MKSIPSVIPLKDGGAYAVHGTVYTVEELQHLPLLVLRRVKFLLRHKLLVDNEVVIPSLSINELRSIFYDSSNASIGYSFLQEGRLEGSGRGSLSRGLYQIDENGVD